MRLKLIIIVLLALATMRSICFAGGDENKCFIAKYSPNGEVIWQKNGISLYSSFACNPQVELDGSIAISFCSRKKDEVIKNVSVRLSPFINLCVDSLKGISLTNSSTKKSFDFGKPFCTDKLDNSYSISQIQKDMVIDNEVIKCYGKSDFIVAKYDKNHNLLWMQQGGAIAETQGLGITVDDDGFIFVSGSIANNDTLTTTPAKVINHRSNKQVIKPYENSFVVYPNPNNGRFVIEYKTSDVFFIYNSIGKHIYKMKLQENSTKQDIDLSALAKGLYFIRLGSETQKIIIE